ncbi:CCA tRNA nucleotidyltransferase [Paeniglutamicibacter antarcticus]|uniref:CCA tRNA nucleotidyltransferase n=1 Tax=Arthrobacter terrae TaxID=2935737 RepID=A0A931CH43_9MICC|nr:CCA tRNA nucleotidyltransferase [Arthrobacter terrae]MBG0738472.1 CCA tRNA nucleotidyltransferase [Arthrobacter terrae]
MVQVLDSSSLDPIVLELGQLFVDAGHEISLVGGPVRDLFLGRTSPDLDFTTDATPEQTLQVARKWADAHWEVGRAFGTIAFRKNGRAGVPLTIEVTTYRAEAYEKDSRKPAVAFGHSLQDDLQRRDFTINSMALRLPALELVDPFGGERDLRAGILRTPAAPESSFSDDPLRMMRAARFAAQLGITVHPEVRAAMTAMAQRIGIISAERIRDELVKLICGAHPRAGIDILVDTGLAGHMLPELPALQLETDEHHRHKDVYQHSLQVLEQAAQLETGPEGTVPRPDFVLRFAALMHDCGKPSTRRFEPAGAVSFRHHDVVGAKLVAKRMKALRFDNDSIKAVARLVELHMRFYGYGEAEWTDSAVRRYVADAGPLLPRLHRLTRSDVTTRNQRKADRLSFAYDDLEGRITVLEAQEELASIRPDLDGAQIMALLGLKPGPVVGRAYKFLLEERMEHGPLGRDDAERRLAQWWAEQPEADDDGGSSDGDSGGSAAEPATKGTP